LLDEKARSPEAVLKIAESKCAGFINIHANWAGGFQSGISKAVLAASADIPTLVGSTYYLGPGTAAYQILSSVLPLEAPCEQVDIGVYGMSGIAEKPYTISGGKIFISDKPGVGIELNEEILEAITIEKMVIK